MPSAPAPQSLTTNRLFLRKPAPADAPAIFAAYAADTTVTRYLGWRRHQTLDDTQTFLGFCDQTWQDNGVGAYLVFDRSGTSLLGSTGLEREDGDCAATGYVLRADAWGKGYATEALRAMLALAHGLSLQKIYALCHPGHQASAHVLEKCGFTRVARLAAHTEFPNLEPGRKQDVLRYEKNITTNTETIRL